MLLLAELWLLLKELGPEACPSQQATSHLGATPLSQISNWSRTLVQTLGTEKHSLPHIGSNACALWNNKLISVDKGIRQSFSHGDCVKTVRTSDQSCICFAAIVRSTLGGEGASGGRPAVRRGDLPRLH